MNERYVVYKQQDCTSCDSQGFQEFVNRDDPTHNFRRKCDACSAKGYIEVPVDLLEVLDKLRWESYITDIGDGVTLSKPHRLERLSIED